jgi:signal transduction histidine kinase
MDQINFSSFLFIVTEKNSAKKMKVNIDKINGVYNLFIQSLSKIKAYQFLMAMENLSKFKSNQPSSMFLEYSCKQVAESFGADTFSIWLIEGTKLIGKYFSDSKTKSGELFYDLSKPEGEGITAESAKSGKSFFLHSVSESYRLYKIKWRGKISDFKDSPPNKADHMMVIPLRFSSRDRSDKKVKGVVRFISSCKRPSFWPIDFEKANSLADTLSLLFYQEELTNQLREDKSKIETINRQTTELLNFMLRSLERIDIELTKIDFLELLSSHSEIEDVDIIDKNEYDHENYFESSSLINCSHSQRIKKLLNEDLDSIIELEPNLFVSPINTSKKLYAIIIFKIISDSKQNIKQWVQMASLCLNSYYSINDLIIEREKLTSRMTEMEKEGISGMYARQIAHEIINGVKAINSWINIYKKGQSPDYQKLSERTKELGDKVDFMLRSTGHNIVRKVCIFNTEVIKILNSLGLRNDKTFNDCTIQLDITDKKQRQVYLDPATLVGIINNLVINASEQYHINKNKGGPIIISIIERNLNDSIYVGLSIKDFALGIHPDIKPKIFKPNFTTKLEGGKGIGLTVVKHLAEVCGGEVMLDTEYGHYTDFQVIYPVD